MGVVAASLAGEAVLLLPDAMRTRLPGDWRARCCIQKEQTMEQQDQTELELQQLVELLASRDWRVVSATWEALVATGDRGLEAVVAGLAHAEARVRRGCADFLD